MIGKDGGGGGKNECDGDNQGFPEAASEKEPMQGYREEQDIPVEATQGNKERAKEKKYGVFARPSDDKKRQHGKEDGFGAEIGRPIKKRATGCQVCRAENFIPGLKNALSPENTKQDYNGKQAKKEHGAPEKPEIGTEERNFKPQEVDVERVIGCERDDFGTVPVGDGAPNSRNGPLVGGVNHADFVIPGRKVLVEEYDKTKNAHEDGEHEKTDGWQTGARDGVDAFTETNKKPDNRRVTKDGETAGGWQRRGRNVVLHCFMEMRENQYTAFTGK